MSGLRTISISLAGPLVGALAIYVLSPFVAIFEGLWGALTVSVILEHAALGKFFGMDPNKFPSGGGSGAWISLPLLPWLLCVTLLIDYVILVLCIYLLLTIWAKISNSLF